MAILTAQFRSRGPARPDGSGETSLAQVAARSGFTLRPLNSPKWSFGALKGAAPIYRHLLETLTTS